MGSDTAEGCINRLNCRGTICAGTACSCQPAFQKKKREREREALTLPLALAQVDVMPFLGRTPEGGPFDAYYEALSDLGAMYVRYAPWCECLHQ